MCCDLFILLACTCILNTHVFYTAGQPAKFQYNVTNWAGATDTLVTLPYRAVGIRSRIDTGKPSIQDVYDVEVHCRGPRYRLVTTSRFDGLSF